MFQHWLLDLIRINLKEKQSFSTGWNKLNPTTKRAFFLGVPAQEILKIWVDDT